VNKDAFIELTNSMPYGVVAVDLNGDVVWHNTVAAELLQTKKLSINENVKEMMRLHFAGCNSSAVQMRSLANPDVYLSLQINAYQHHYHLLTIEDITHTIKLETMRQKFVADVSHELRTPLTVFHGYLQLLTANAQVPEDKLAEIVVQMYAQAERMERLVEDLLLLSRLEVDEPDDKQCEPVCVPAMLSAILQDARTLSAGGHQFELEVDQQLYIQGYEDEIISAFTNLIFNAIYYTPAPGKIIIRWYRQGKHAYFEVEDNGLGIADKYLQRITQRFYRVDKSRKYRGQCGTGLGLAIVKHVLLRHEAILNIQSQLGEGSVFQCRFNV
jgi:two-component system, OmpR family, phosphate regulon sensor histidine kinase PhoR